MYNKSLVVALIYDNKLLFIIQKSIIYLFIDLPITVILALSLTVSNIPSVDTSQVYLPVISTCKLFNTTVRSSDLRT